MARTWRHSVGERPNTVTVYERRRGSPLYVRAWDPSMGAAGAFRKRSLGYPVRYADGKIDADTKDRAETYAAEQHAKLRAGDGAMRSGRVTLNHLLALYETHRSPQKGKAARQGDKRLAELWTRFLGADKDPQLITLREWEDFVRVRSSGEIDARGKRVPEVRREQVSPRTVEQDLRFLLAVLNWGIRWRTETGYLLAENACRGYPLPKELNPRRPIATEERVNAIHSVAAQVTMNVKVAGKRRAVPSHLPAIFALAVETGRRLSAICGLRYSDLLLSRGPHGSIRWRAELDKTGRESVVPMSPAARRAIDRVLRERPGIGDVPLFPSPLKPDKPVDRSRVDRWLRRAEAITGLESQDGSLWHAYRRRWATVRKHLPATDVAEAGGWAGPETLQHCYQQADADTMYTVVTGGGQLRAAR